MWLEKFIKRNFISFYKEENYNLLLETVKNKNIINSQKKEFENKKELEKFVIEKINENPQTYTSTVLLTLNQGVINSCQKKDYLKRDIDYNNIQFICINNQYSFYTSIYDLNKTKKEYKFELDFIYSIFAPIDFLAKERKNRFYVLVLKEYLAILGYEDFIPIFSDIITINEKEEEEEEEHIEDIEEIDILDDLTENIEDIEDLDDIEELEEENTTQSSSTNIEVSLLNFVQASLKEYYEHYSEDFIEKIIILDTAEISPSITRLLEDEILIPAEYKKIDLLETINRMSVESL